MVMTFTELYVMYCKEKLLLKQRLTDDGTMIKVDDGRGRFERSIGYGVSDSVFLLLFL